MTQEKICMLIAMGVYMVAVVVVGVICAKRNKTADDFYLGGRKLNPLVAAMRRSASSTPASRWTAMLAPFPWTPMTS